jgi:hypothetical protein
MTGGRGEWESIQILRWNSTYVSKLTQRTSLLIRSRLYSYRQTTGTQNQGRKPQITMETWINTGKNTCDTMTTIKNWTKKSVQVLTVISPNTLGMCSRNHRVREIRTKKTQIFWYGNSRTIPALTCIYPRTIETTQILTVAKATCA